MVPVGRPRPVLRLELTLDGHLVPGEGNDGPLSRRDRLEVSGERQKVADEAVPPRKGSVRTVPEDDPGCGVESLVQTLTDDGRGGLCEVRPPLPLFSPVAPTVVVVLALSQTTELVVGAPVSVEGRGRGRRSGTRTPGPAPSTPPRPDTEWAKEVWDKVTGPRGSPRLRPARDVEVGGKEVVVGLQSCLWSWRV